MTGPVLFIGGMDSSGGAGLLRDAATAQRLDAPHRVAVTAVSAQSDRRVAAVLPMPPAVLEAQMALALAEGIAAAKTGMLATAELVGTVARLLPSGVPLVVDPVLRSSSGRALLTDDGLAAMLAELVPRATVLTPNLPELDALSAGLGCPGADEQTAVGALLACGCAAVLVKGGHRDDPAQSDDRLYRAGRPAVRFRAPRLSGDLRGTGCQLASGIAIALARGSPLDAAIRSAKRQVRRRFLAAAGPI